MYLFGPATVTFNGASLGKTFGGCSLQFHFDGGAIPLVGDVYGFSDFSYGTGELRLYEFDEYVLTEDGVRNDWGELVFTTSTHKITLFYTQLHYPNSFQVGINSQQPFTLRLVFKKHPTTNKVMEVVEV